MAIHSLGTTDSGSDSDFNPMYKAPDNYIPGDGLLDRFQYMETMSLWIKRILSRPSFWIHLVIYALLQYFFIWIEFGTVFMIFASIYFMITSLRGSEQSRQDVRSAYSVFNIQKKGGRLRKANIHGDESFEEMDRRLRGLGSN